MHKKNRRECVVYRNWQVNVVEAREAAGGIEPEAARHVHGPCREDAEARIAEQQGGDAACMGSE
jgi:hypothetical protein